MTATTCLFFTSIAVTDRSAALDTWTVLLFGVNVTQFAAAEIGPWCGRARLGNATSPINFSSSSE